jgi:hypothetical protein
VAADLPDDPEARVIAVTGWRDIGKVGIGTLASLDGELVRIDGITATAITVGRGCLDTVPRTHVAGTPVIFFDEVARITESAWAAGETLAARLLPETGHGTLAFALAPEDSVTLDRRAVRPLPPGRVQGNGSYLSLYRSGITVSFILHLGHQPTDIASISGLLSTKAGGFDATLDVNAIRHVGASTYSAPFSIGIAEPVGDLWLGFR